MPNVGQYKSTANQIPHAKQVMVHGLLAQNFPYKRIAKIVGISVGSICAIARHVPTTIEEVEVFKKALVARAYAISTRAFEHMTDEKLNACSAPQLMMVAGIAIDKARDLEGLNRPIINVVDIAMNIQKLTEQSRARLQEIEGQIEQRSDLT